jgi:hypothetical protein
MEITASAIEKLLSGATTDSRRRKKGENVTISFPKRKIVRFSDGEQLSAYDAFFKYVTKLAGSESPTVVMTRILSLAKNYVLLQQQAQKRKE